MSQNEFSITIGIPTFNRSDHLHSLFRQLEELGAYININTYNITLLVSDNASSDNTQVVVNKFRSRLGKVGYNVSCFCQAVNLGMDGNFRFLYENCKSDYLWYFSDDDILVSENVEKLLNDLKTYKPDVCLSNFIQSPYTDRDTIFLSSCNSKKEIITDLRVCVDRIKKFPKLTNYIVKKIHGSNFDSLVYDCIGGYYLFVVYAMLSFSKGGSLLVRSSSIAMARSNCLSIDYSPRAFTGLNRSVNKVLKYLGGDERLDLMVTERETDEMSVALSYLIMHYRGKLNLQPKLLLDERMYVRDNLRYIVVHPRIMLKYMIYLISIIRHKFIFLFKVKLRFNI